MSYKLEATIGKLGVPTEMNGCTSCEACRRAGVDIACLSLAGQKLRLVTASQEGAESRNLRGPSINLCPIRELVESADNVNVARGRRMARQLQQSLWRGSDLLLEDDVEIPVGKRPDCSICYLDGKVCFKDDGGRSIVDLGSGRKLWTDTDIDRCQIRNGCGEDGEKNLIDRSFANLINIT